MRKSQQAVSAADERLGPAKAAMIQHLTREIRPSKLEDCVQFYAFLGFERVSVPAGLTGRAVWLELKGTQVHLMPTPDACPQSGHVAIVVEHYDGTVARLRAEGHDVEPRRAHWGSPRAYVRDPAGNLVELMAWPPGRESAGRRGAA